MNKKGMFVEVVLTATLLAILIATLLIPQVKTTTDSQSVTETLVRDDAPNAENVTLAQASAFDLESASLSVTGLTVGANYSVDYDTGVVTFNSSTANGSYASTYGYYDSGYLENSAQRSLMAIVILASILGLFVLLMKGFGVM